jgi:hypothetical protein
MPIPPFLKEPALDNIKGEKREKNEKEKREKNVLFFLKEPALDNPRRAVQVGMRGTQLQHHGAPALLHRPKRARLVCRERQRGQSRRKALLQQHLLEWV